MGWSDLLALAGSAIADTLADVIAGETIAHGLGRAAIVLWVCLLVPIFVNPVKED